MSLVHAIIPGSVSAGTIVRLAEGGHVPYNWSDVLAVVVGVDGMDAPGDSLVVQSACERRLSIGVESVYRLDAIERLAWIAWKAQVDGFKDAITEFRTARDRENEWITSGEIIRVSEDDYTEDTDRAFSGRFLRDSDPLDAEDIEYLSTTEWSNRQRWITGRVVGTPNYTLGHFCVEVLTDEADRDNYVGDTIEVPWYRAFRIEPTPENEDE